MADTLWILVPSDKQPLLTFKVARKCCQCEEFHDVKRIQSQHFHSPHRMLSELLSCGTTHRNCCAASTVFPSSPFSSSFTKNLAPPTVLILLEAGEVSSASACD